MQKVCSKVCSKNLLEHIKYQCEIRGPCAGEVHGPYLSELTIITKANIISV